jgi:hypothetical protein
MDIEIQGLTPGHRPQPIVPIMRLGTQASAASPPRMERIG